MGEMEKKDQPKRRVSKTTMLVGAAGLFLFIVGVKRSMRADDVHLPADDQGTGGPPEGGPA